MIIDIRKEQEEEITGIKFDESPDYVCYHADSGYLAIVEGPGDIRLLCSPEDLDNFIAALYKAKELSGK